MPCYMGRFAARWATHRAMRRENRAADMNGTKPTARPPALDNTEIGWFGGRRIKDVGVLLSSPRTQQQIREIAGLIARIQPELAAAPHADATPKDFPRKDG